MKKIIAIVAIAAVMVSGITASASARTINQVRLDMSKAHQLSEIGRYFGMSDLVVKGQLLYGQAVVELATAQADECECEASRSATREYIGTFRLTAYCSGCDGSGITAIGVKPRVDHTVAVDPSVIPLGSRLYVEGIGYCVAEDTGGVVKGKTVDVYIPAGSNGRCACSKNFGVKNARVYYLR